MTACRDIWGVVPIKRTTNAKQRLAGFLSPYQRESLAQVMLEEVLTTVSRVRGLAGTVVVTHDLFATAVARRLGLHVVTEGADDGHTGSVNAGIGYLLGNRRAGMLTLPIDIPAATAAEIETVLREHRDGRSFTISPAHDDLGSNVVICSPPDAVPLRCGSDSFYPHLEAASRAGITPIIVRQPGIAMDIDNPADITAFLQLEQSEGTRTRRFLEAHGLNGVAQGTSPARYGT